ncbi:MAG: hypothetical protein E7363_06025 [Clostridiales bacterium]|nr:hypothetical protein [Clostridiales bacterium]
MLHSITPTLGALYVLVLFFLSFACVIAIQYGLAFFHTEKREKSQSRQDNTATPVYYVLQKHPTPRKKRIVKKRKPQPKRELYYLSTLQKEEESE